MPYNDLREFIQRVEQEGELAHIKAEVDIEYEIGAVCHKAFFSEGDPEKRKALIFERPKGYEIPLAVNLLGTRKRMCMALETTPESFHRDWLERSARPIKPVIVDWGPCKENIFVGDEVNLFKFPIPIWNEKDGGPYITLPCWISKDPETGWRNSGMYRTQVHDKRTVGLWASPYRHISMQWRKAFAKGEGFSVAVAIGCDPVVTIATVARAGHGTDEVSLAGGLRGRPVELVRCETVPLEVPATAEWVLEGEIKVGALKQEGPYGEAYGYYGEALPREFMEVKAITHRNNPIHQACYLHRPPNEASFIRLSDEANIIAQCPVGGVISVNVLDSVTVASITKTFDGQAKMVGMGILGSTGGRQAKIMIVVDEDVNPHNLHEVLWAISSRCQPERDVEILKDISSVGIDPSMPEESKRLQTGLSSKMIIDATKPVRKPFSEAVAPKREVLERVEREWERYGIT
ncbi:UbiD family decarboxylase [Chloroflexota bacterium]